MITSHETCEDFKHFLFGLAKVCEELDIEFDPEWTMQDAQLSCKQAVQTVCANTTVLMCFFHVMSNIKKFQKSNKTLVADDDFNLIKDDIRSLHYSKDEEEWENGKKEFKKKWSKQSPHIYKNINEQWFNGEFSKWQVYHNPPGFAGANSNMEGINGDFKTFFTRKRLSMICAVEKIGECILYYSENAEPFSIKPRIYRRMTQKAANISKNNFNKASKSSARYYSREHQVEYTLNWKYEPCCDCFGFLKKAVCSHLLAYSYLFEMNWYGPKIIKAIADSKNFEFKTKRGAKKKNGPYHRAEKALIRK